MKRYNILFLGSSVTYGTASGGYSFADCISKKNGAYMYKEAVGGTTLTDEKARETYFNELFAKYTECSVLTPEISEATATDSKLNVNITLDPHAVVFYEITPVK